MGTIPAWAGLALALIAGAGLLALYLKLRRPRVVDPGTVGPAEINELAMAFAAALQAAAAGRTARHGYDTLEVFADGVHAGAHARPVDPVHVDPYADGRFSGLAPADAPGDDGGEGWYVDAPPRTPR